MNEKGKEDELKTYNSLENDIIEFFDEEFAKVNNGYDYHKIIDFKTVIPEEKDKEQISEALENHIESYRNNPEYTEWEIKLNREKLKVTIINETLRRSEEWIRKHFERKIEYLNIKINRLKETNYKGTINAKDSEDKLVFDRIITRDRNDIIEVNEGQYKFIYDNISNEVKNFEIESNRPFYEYSEEFKNKKLLKKFLDKSKKVNINPDMSFIPFQYKQDDKFYILVTNNVLENIELYDLKSLNFLNKQHNVYYILEINMDNRFKGKLNDFKAHIVKSCQKFTNYNKNILYDTYKTISNFKDESSIVKI
jgi:hypothetical protein